jgi:hypothetical protein
MLAMAMSDHEALVLLSSADLQRGLLLCLYYAFIFHGPSEGLLDKIPKARREIVS